MININPIVKYSRTALTKFRHAESFIGKNADRINDGLGATNDIVSNAQIGRELVQFSRPTTTIAPGFGVNYGKNVNEILDNHLDKIELTKDLDEREKQEFLKNIEPDRSSFITFAMDAKPSILICGKNEFLKPNENYDILRRTITVTLKGNKTAKFDNTIILNKELTKKTIEENKELYIKRMGLNEDADTDEIYNELIGENSPLKENEKHDIIGITLGFSPVNSIIYQLDQNIPQSIEKRKDLNTYKKSLLNELLSDNSPYKDFDNDFKKNIATLIRDIGNNKNTFKTPWDKFGFTYRNIVPDDKHDQKLIRNIITSYKKTQSILREDT